MEISTKPLADSLGQLATHMGLVNSTLGKADENLGFAFATAAIKSFEYSFEISVKLIRRRLEMSAAAPSQVDQMDYREVVQAAAEQGIISDWRPWMEFRNNRNATSHTYDHVLALKVCEALPVFLAEAKCLLVRLQDKAAAHVS